MILSDLFFGVQLWNSASIVEIRAQVDGHAGIDIAPIEGRLRQHRLAFA